MGWARRQYTCTLTTGGQNKNAIMVQYLLWRVMTKQHSEITLSFMILGHTKFSPDWCFGLLKKYWKMKVGGLSDLCGVVNDSTSHRSANRTGGWVLLSPPITGRSTSYNFARGWRGSGSYTICASSLLHLASSLWRRELELQRWRGVSSKTRTRSPRQTSYPLSSHPLQWQCYLYEKIREFCPDHLRIPLAHSLADQL